MSIFSFSNISVFVRNKCITGPSLKKNRYLVCLRLFFSSMLCNVFDITAQPDGPSDDEQDGEGEDGEEEDTTVYQYVPPVSKPWESQGSELEIVEESMAESRKKVNHFRSLKLTFPFLQ